MLLKIFGALIITCSSLLFGIEKSNEYENRVTYLESMQFCVLQLENEIRYTQTPIFLALKKVSVNAHPIIKKLFYNTCNEDESGKTFFQLWTNSLDGISSELFREDAHLFLSLGESIGCTDVEGQIKSIELFKLKLNHQTQAAKEVCQKNKKLYKSLGLYSGILITVLLL